MKLNFFGLAFAPFFCAFLLPLSLHAETLIADVPLRSSTAHLTIDVSAGRIRTVAVDLPAVSLPTPWEWQFDNDYVYNGVEGYTYNLAISPQLVSNASLRYHLRKYQSAREHQFEEKIYTYEGTKVVFYPNGGGASTILEQDLTPYRAAYSGIKTRKASVSAGTEKNGSLVLRLQDSSRKNSDNFSYFALGSVDTIGLILTPAGKSRWNVELQVIRSVSSGDIVGRVTVKGTATLRGRAKIDATDFSGPPPFLR